MVGLLRAAAAAPCKRQPAAGAHLKGRSHRVPAWWGRVGKPGMEGRAGQRTSLIGVCRTAYVPG